MANIESYHDLTKKQEDLLSKNYSFGTSALLNLNLSADNFTFHSKIGENKNEGNLASTWVEFANSLFSFKHKRTTAKYSQYKVEVTPKDVVKDLKVTFDCKLWGGSDKRLDPSIALDYHKSTATGRLAYHTESSIIAASVTGGKQEVGAGVDLKYNLKQHELVSVIPAVWWINEQSRLVVKYATDSFKLGTAHVSYYQKVNPTTTLASKIASNLKSGETEIEVGGEYNFDPSSLIKAKVNSFGNLALAFTRTLSKNFQATVATEINTQSLVSHADSNYKLGFRFDFNS